MILADRIWEQLGPVFDIAGDRDATCEWEPVPETKLIRLYLVSKIFKHMPYYERQAFVWQSLRTVGAEAMRVSMLFTLAPGEEL